MSQGTISTYIIVKSPKHFHISYPRHLLILEGNDNYVGADMSQGTCVIFLVVLSGSDVAGR
jgi:hypothetical protein